MRWWPRWGTGRIDQADTAGITVANTGVIGSITIGPATYLLEDFPLAPASHPDPAALAPSRLLAARHQLVPFTGREAELGQLVGWREEPAGVAVQLVYASGGQGKTRRRSHDRGGITGGGTKPVHLHPTTGRSIRISGWW